MAFAHEPHHVNNIGMEFVLIPAGSFLMGTADSEAQAASDEKPLHEVVISKPFYLANHQSREIATVAALASIKGVNAQLQSHFNIAMNTGLTPDQMKALVDILKSKVGQDEGRNAEQVLAEVLKSRK